MIKDLENAIGYRFQNITLLQNALTHSSYANERWHNSLMSNERLEFLGDSVLGMVVAEYLYRTFPNRPEGELTRMRADMVCEKALAKVAAPGSSIGMEHLSGPVGIGNYLYQMLSSTEGWKLILWFAVVLNVNLAVLNILPLPIVDGGHVVLGTLEIIFRRPVGGKILEWIQTGFMFLILTFFIFVTFKDVGDMVGGDEDAATKLPDPVVTK